MRYRGPFSIKCLQFLFVSVACNCAIKFLVLKDLFLNMDIKCKNTEFSVTEKKAYLPTNSGLLRYFTISRIYHKLPSLQFAYLFIMRCDITSPLGKTRPERTTS